MRKPSLNEQLDEYERTREVHNALRQAEREAGRGPEKLNGWRPISTAPKGDGGTYVLLYAKHICVGVWFERRWKPIHSNETVHPTHWMPLPPKPII